MRRWLYKNDILVDPSEEAYFIIAKMRDKNSFHVTFNQLWTEDWWIKRIQDPAVKTFTFGLKVLRADRSPAGVIGSGKTELLKSWVFKAIKENGFLVWKREILRRDQDYEYVIFEAFRKDEFERLWKEKYGES
jgi:hypothetical protein